MQGNIVRGVESLRILRSGGWTIYLSHLQEFCSGEDERESPLWPLQQLIDAATIEDEGQHQSAQGSTSTEIDDS